MDSTGPRPLCVLLVEDNPGDIDLIRSGLEEIDANVSLAVARDGLLALEVLEKGCREQELPDLVLLDLKLGRTSGLDVLEEMKGHPALRSLPVVVLTSSRAPSDVARVYALQATACFSKPLRGMGDLLGKIMDFVSAATPRPASQLDAESELRGEVARPSLAGTASDVELAAIVRSAADAIVGLGNDGTIRSWNTAAESLYGYTAAEAVGRSIRMMVPEDRFDELWQRIQRCTEACPVYFETVRIAPDGHELEVGLTVAPIRGGQHDTTGYSLIAHDIYGRRQAERKFELAVEASASGMVMVDANGTIVLVNAEAERQFGYRRGELVGAPIEKLLPERFRGEHPARRGQFFALPSSRAMGAGRELFGRRKDGTEFPVETGLNPIRTAEGVFVLASILDITERKQAEQRFRLAVEASPSGIVMVDDRGSIVLVNAETERLFGYPRDELIGMSIEELVPARFRGQHRLHRDGFQRDPKKRAMGSGRDLYGLRKDSTEFPIEIGLNPIETESGTMTLSTIVDITERKQAEHELEQKTQELERSNADLEQFAYVASHDLQEPLRMVAGHTELLAKRYGEVLDEKGRRYISYAQDGAERMQRLIDDLLAYSRVGRHGQAGQPVDAQLCLEHALANLELAIRESSANIQRASLPVVLADESLLTEVFQNLVHNAIKFHGQEPPRLSISASMAHGACTFRVIDNGVGVPIEHRQRIFQVFQRLHTREQAPGTGIGLALCKRVVEQYGGEIWVETAPGGGSCFLFSLPVAPSSPS